MMEWSQSLQGQQDAFTWFKESQLRTVIRNGIVPEWFHGIISRKTAEELLMPKPPGYFLIRVSETRIGYTLSYRTDDRCRHFMIDASEDGQYVIVGENRRHRSLQDLVDFHRRNPIMPFTEVLTVACGQSSIDRTDYAELLFPQRHPKHNGSLPPNNSTQQLNRSQPESQVDGIPPALPYRPTNLLNSPVQFPSSQPNRLYPNLKDEYPHMASPLPAKPVPQPRKVFAADNPPSNQPPEVPARTCLPPPKQNQACIRTVSAPQGPSTAMVTEAKPSVVSNLKNLKKKFQKKRSTSQEHMYTEVDVEAKGGITENEYQEITQEETVSSAPFSYVHHNVLLSDGVLPQEYMPPPPFAPGY